MNKQILFLIFLIFSCSEKIPEKISEERILKEETKEIKSLKKELTHTVIRIDYEPYAILTNVVTNVIINGANNIIWALPHKLAKKYFDITNEKEYKYSQIGERHFKDSNTVDGMNEISITTSQYLFLDKILETGKDLLAPKWKDKYTNFKVGDKVKRKTNESK